jgi:hypothetical protein
MTTALEEHSSDHVSADALARGFTTAVDAPNSRGTLQMIVVRPGVGEREVLTEGRLDEQCGLIGDSWEQRGSSRSKDRKANPLAQVTLMNSRAIALIAGSRERWQLAGDQLYIDLDLSVGNLPAGSRLQIGEAILEITAEPHTGCSSFKARYGSAATAFVNSPEGLEHRLRGVNARVISGGSIRSGDAVLKL